MRFGWMRFRWPTNAADSVASWRMTAPPPALPRIQESRSRSRLSSWSRATLVCNIRLPRGDVLVERGRVRRGGKALPQIAVAEHLRELGQDLEMLLGRLLRHEEHEDQVDRAAVGRDEGQRAIESRVRRIGVAHAIHP